MRLKSGFTIIEVMLFLAITGLLVAGIVGTTTESLNSKRYRSGVESFRNLIRSQYEKVYSLTNLTAENDSGDLGSNAIDPCSVMEDDSTPRKTYRGTSDCLYVGRFIMLEPNQRGDATKVSVIPVVAKILEPSAYMGVFESDGFSSIPPENVTDSNGIQAAVFTGNKNIISIDEVAWGLSVVEPNSDTIKSFGIFIFRSPMTGTVSTYIVDDLSTDHLNQLQQDITVDHVRDVKMCMADLTGSLDPAVRSAILVHAGATGPGGVETLGGGSSGC